MDQPRLALAVGVWLLLTTAVDGATVHGSAFLFRLGVAIACVLGWPRTSVSLPQLHLIPPAYALLVVSAGLLFTPHSGLGVQIWISVLFVVALFTTALANSRDWLTPILPAVCAVGAAHTVWAVAQKLLGAERGHGGFFNPNDLSAFLVPVVVLAAGRAVSSTATARRWWLGGVVVLSVGVLATGSRAGALAGLLGIALSSIPLLLRRRRAALILVGAIVFAAAITLPRWQGFGDPFAYDRVAIWRSSVDVALAKPMGVGLAQYPHAMRIAGVPLESGPVRYPKLAKQSHSEPLQAWVELGWPGLLATLMPAGLLLLVIARRRRWVDAGVLVAFALPAGVSNSLHVPPVAALAALWAAGVLREDPGAEGAFTFNWGNRSRAWLALAVGAPLLLAVPDAVSDFSMRRAASHRAEGRLADALWWAELASTSAPWRAGAAVQRESLRYLSGTPVRVIGPALIDIADSHPWEERPLDRAAALLEKQAAAGSDASAWLAAAELRAAYLERNPFDALGWTQLALDRLRGGDADGGREALERAVSMEPHCARAAAMLARLEADAGNAQRARALARIARESGEQAAAWDDHAGEVLTLPDDLRSMLEDAGL